ncbi:hypothetical protein CONLIGDRAFT_673183 [Coniochaeta ligniaria NRRL 30616]|uniref:Uncharacterized protein n=1 Tax=Coniochaeta ligniaria NRRL 30616 TaxID=1408157 RepID=A0A1J7IV28_9PEZI|nr:hypothetical protein CONLIGDRAFT_673183 [Coniochaeta ligniaria NRRL 30616]
MVDCGSTKPTTGTQGPLKAGDTPTHHYEPEERTSTECWSKEDLYSRLPTVQAVPPVVCDQATLSFLRQLVRDVGGCDETATEFANKCLRTLKSEVRESIAKFQFSIGCPSFGGESPVAVVRYIPLEESSEFGKALKSLLYRAQAEVEASGIEPLRELARTGLKEMEQARSELENVFGTCSIN